MFKGLRLSSSRILASRRRSSGKEGAWLNGKDAESDVKSLANHVPTLSARCSDDGLHTAVRQEASGLKLSARDDVYPRPIPWMSSTFRALQISSAGHFCAQSAGT